MSTQYDNPLWPKTQEEIQALSDDYWMLPDPNEVGDDGDMNPDVLYEGESGYDEMVALREASLRGGDGSAPSAD